MKPMKLVWLFSTVLTLGLMGAASWADDPDPGDQGGPPPEPDIQGVALAGVINQFAPSLDAAFNGFGPLAINGVSAQCSIISQPLDLSNQTDNFGRLVGKKTTLLDFGNGDTLTTEDAVLLTPTESGWYSAQATMTVTGGTGVFANARGVIDASGLIQTDGSSVQALWLVEGRVLT